MKLISILGLVFLLANISYGQDTLRLEKRPQVILKSWYPEFKEFPALKVGESKILYSIIPDLEKTSIGNNDINLTVKNNLARIEKTEKPNQFLVTAVETDATCLEFEIWVDLGNLTIHLEENSKWVDIRTLYTVKDNHVMLQKVKLKIEN